MTDTFNALTVVLEKNIREDDAVHIIDAIKQLRGVLNVQGNVSDNLSEHVAKSRLTEDINKRLWKALYD